MGEGFIGFFEEFDGRFVVPKCFHHVVYGRVGIGDGGQFGDNIEYAVAVRGVEKLSHFLEEVEIGFEPVFESVGHRLVSAEGVGLLRVERIVYVEYNGAGSGELSSSNQRNKGCFKPSTLPVRFRLVTIPRTGGLLQNQGKRGRKAGGKCVGRSSA